MVFLAIGASSGENEDVAFGLKSMLPVVGPLVAGATAAEPEGIWVALGVLYAVMELAGLTLLIVGARRQAQRRAEAAAEREAFDRRLSLVLGPGGLALSGRY